MLDYAWADRSLGSRSSAEVVCPECSHQRKAAHRRLACLGLRRITSDRIVYKCMNCGIGGPLTEGFREDGEDRQRFRREPTPRRDSRADGLRPTTDLAASLWGQSVEPMGTETEAYWRHRGLAFPIPPSIRHLRHQGRPVMLGAVGAPVLHGDHWSPPATILGVQRTFLNPGGEGRDKAAGKRSLGQIAGSPLPVHVNPESLSLVIGEGIEKSHALARAMNVDGWASCGTAFFRHLVGAVSDLVECVTILVDPGAEPQVQPLAEGLTARGIQVLLAR